MNRNFPRYADLSEAGKAEADSRNTDPAIWLAINYLVDRQKEAHAGANTIWASPTPAEIDWVRMCLKDWERHGDIEPGTYCWGEKNLTVEAA